MNDTSLLNTALVSLLIGGGGYSALRGINDLSGANKPKPLDNEIEITLPSSRVPKEKIGAEEGFLNTLMQNANQSTILPALAVGGGLYGGFRGASALYDHFANKDIDNEKEEVKNNYLAALQKANTKVGSLDTPNVDSFIGGLLDKIAQEDEVGLLGLLAGTAGDKLKSVGQQAWDGAKGLGNATMNSLAKSEPAGLAAGAMGLLGLGAAGTTYYLANRMDQNKEEANRKTNLPTEIRLNVQ